jgi:hypothetical protein
MKFSSTLNKALSLSSADLTEDFMSLAVVGFDCFYGFGLSLVKPAIERFI